MSASSTMQRTRYPPSLASTMMAPTLTIGVKLEPTARPRHGACDVRQPFRHAESCRWKGGRVSRLYASTGAITVFTQTDDCIGASGATAAMARRREAEVTSRLPEPWSPSQRQPAWKPSSRRPSTLHSPPNRRRLGSGCTRRWRLGSGGKHSGFGATPTITSCKSNLPRWCSSLASAATLPIAAPKAANAAGHACSLMTGTGVYFSWDINLCRQLHGSGHDQRSGGRLHPDGRPRTRVVLTHVIPTMTAMAEKPCGRRRLRLEPGQFTEVAHNGDSRHRQPHTRAFWAVTAPLPKRRRTVGGRSARFAVNSWRLR